MKTIENAACPPLTDLREFLVDRLPSDQLSRVHSHVTECAGCQQILEDLLEQQGGLSTLESLLKVRACGLHAAGQGFAAAATETPGSAPESLPRPSPQSSADHPPDEPLPKSIGGYRIVKELGRGAYGVVYHAYDDNLDRPMAIKVPHRKVVKGAGGIELYLKEAKALASLDHPHIVRVYEARRDGPDSCYIASQLIEGSSLAARLKYGPLPFQEAARMLAPLADALQHAHERGIWHRDVKPANILLDAAGKPYLADFGLAMCAAEIGQGDRLLGTPAYMSPEQARGEGHLVDGRTDIFSLGVVCYETLTGQRPFLAPSLSQLLELVIHVDAPSVRQKDRTIPTELDHICAKALSRPLSDRYRSASDMAADLQAWLSASSAGKSSQSGKTMVGLRDPFATHSGQTRTIGPFQLRTRLGSGGMGIVYRAWQPAEDREVALKCLRLEDDAARGRFLNEIRALGKVDHPNLVRIYTSGEDQDRLYFAMELVDGAGLPALQQHLRPLDRHALDEDAWLDTVRKAADQARSQERPLLGGAADTPSTMIGQTVVQHDDPEPVSADFHESSVYIRRVATMVQDLAWAAQALHDAGVVHRDIKPENILLTRDGERVVLMDLGIAKLNQDESGRVTRTREFVGSLRYASPEQIIDSGQVDHRSDIYSLGVTLWELLTRRPMYGISDDMRDSQAMLKIEIEEPDPISKYNRSSPRDLNAIVQKCLEKHPDRRYASAAALAEDLARFLQGQPVIARPVRLPTRVWRRCRRRPWATGMMLAVCAAALAVALWPQPLRLAMKPWVGFAPLQVAYDLDLCDGLNLELVPVDHAHAIHQQFEARTLDAGGYVVDSHAYERGGGEPTKIVLQLDVSGTADAIVAGREIATIADLRGRKVACVHMEAPHFLLLALCEKHNLQRGDFSIVFADSVELAGQLFIAGQVDAVVTYEPFLTLALEVPGAHPLATASDDPGAIIDTLVVREQYLKNNRTKVQALIAGWFKAVELLQQRNPAAMESACRFLGENGKPITWEEYEAMEQGMTYGGIEQNIQFFLLDAQGNNEYHRRFNTSQNRLETYDLIRVKSNPKDADGSELFLQMHGRGHATN